MRKTLISLIMLTIAANIAAQDFLNNSEINSQWRQKTISVKNGGQTPDVVKLLRAFNEVMPTWTVSQVLKQADHPAKGTRQSGTAVIWDGEEEDDYRILIDRRNGYADLASQTDIDQTAAQERLCRSGISNRYRPDGSQRLAQGQWPPHLRPITLPTTWESTECALLVRL